MSPAKADRAVRVQGLEKSFGDWPVLWDLDLTLDWGQLLVLAGPNGSGKTTLLRILSTQVKPDFGAVSIAGFDLKRQPNQVRRCVGVVGHNTFLHSDLTCLENLVFYGRLFRLQNPGKTALEVLAQVGLEHRAGHRVRTLSNGMQRRVSLARALLHDPLLLLLDEPEVGLDGPSVAMLGELITRWTGLGRSIVMTTHNLELVKSWPGSQGHLDNGKVRIGEDRPSAVEETGPGL
ncbi:MAG: heme ABC exporter, ATP-binding protein CcmA [SAR202 cluster bacterium Io17-Chloro-G2]|nr:MAG: heme ABC exporter, ATP-binding protein CcmA [SAR202 cluster bacterium Io17-Chloro-G2]